MYVHRFVDQLFYDAIMCRAGGRMLLLDPTSPLYQACMVEGLADLVDNDERNAQFFGFRCRHYNSPAFRNGLPPQLLNLLLRTRKTPFGAVDFFGWALACMDNCVETASSENIRLAQEICTYFQMSWAPYNGIYERTLVSAAAENQAMSEAALRHARAQPLGDNLDQLLAQHGAAIQDDAVAIAVLALNRELHSIYRRGLETPFIVAREQFNARRAYVLSFDFAEKDIVTYKMLKDNGGRLPAVKGKPKP